MALVTMKELLERAKNNHRGIGAFSVGNMEMVKGAIQAAEELDTPIILQIAEVRLKHSPLALMGPMMIQAAKEAKVDVAVHLDHGLTMEMVEKALELGFTCLADGTNASDDVDDRPGMKALQEMKVLSPLRICGITKPALRDVSEQLGLFTARKPAYACLATRIPTGTRITAEQLEKVEQAESALMDMGFSDFRVRHPEGYAKLQVKPEQLSLVLEKREEILAVLEPLFGTVCLDMKTR